MAAPDSHRDRVGAWPMWLLGLVIMVDQVDVALVRGLVTELKADPRLHMTDLKVGVLQSSFVVVNGLITVPAGYLADRWNRTRTIGHTVIGWSLITAFTGAFASFGWMIGVRSALGFGQAVTEPSCASLLGDYYEPERRGRAFSNHLDEDASKIFLAIAEAMQAQQAEEEARAAANDAATRPTADPRSDTAP